MDIISTIAKNLSAWIDESHRFTTIESVAKAAGIGSSAVQRIKDGVGNPTVKNIEALAKAFGRMPHDLIAPPKERKPSLEINESEATYASHEQTELNFQRQINNLSPDEREIIYAYRIADDVTRETMFFLSCRTTAKLGETQPRKKNK